MLDWSTIWLEFQLYDQVTGKVICHGEKSLMNAGHKSFPSGHTSCKFYHQSMSFVRCYSDFVTKFDAVTEAYDY